MQVIHLSLRDPSHPLRICAVSYFNTTPLVWGLRHRPPSLPFQLEFRLPAACADALADNQADVGLIPAVELLRLPVNVIPGVGIACTGPVRSILLVSQVPVAEIRTLATDTSSRTSVALARIVLRERYHVEPLLLPAAPDLSAMLAQADAALLIGDPALLLDPATLPFQVLDLGQEWHAMTGWPMVFAVWAARQEVDPVPLKQVFRDSYEYGAAHLDEIVAQEAPPRHVPAALAHEYLTRFIQFRLGDLELKGLAHFLQHAQHLPHPFQQEELPA